MQLGLGTAQFGFDYGISNRYGRVPTDTVRDLLDTAYANRIRVLDTAASYGESEETLGRVIPSGRDFHIITKLLPTDTAVIDDEALDRLKDGFHASLARLRVKSVAGLLLHRPGELFLPGGERLYELLRAFREDGFAGKIGVSVYDGGEIERLFARFDFDIVQAPSNVLDQRLVTSGHIEALRKKGVEIHIRSVFLQGLLLMPSDDIHPYFAPVLPVIRRYRRFLEKRGLTPVGGALGFIRDVVRPHVALVGVTSLRELNDIIRALKTEPLDSEDYAQFAIDDETMINPIHWKTGS